MLRPALLAALVMFAAPAHAIVGGAPADPALAAHVVSIVSTGGASCSGVVVAQNLVVTAGHCVDRPGNYAVLIRGPSGFSVAEIDSREIHPAWTRAHYEQRKPSPDLALVRTRTPLPPAFRPLALTRASALPADGVVWTLAGWGFAEETNERSAGTLRSVALAVFGRNIGGQARLRAAGGAVAGACHYDSGGAALAEEDGRRVLAGVIAWSTGAGQRQCGAVSAATAVGPVRSWLAEAARRLGGRLGE